MTKKKDNTPPAAPPPARGGGAAEEDARAMLLAAGLTPVDGVSALEQLASQLPPIPRGFFTIAEFCEYTRMSVATYHRKHAAKKGPRVTMLFGHLPRISREHALEWLASQNVVEPDPLPEPPKPRKPRLVINGSTARAAPRKPTTVKRKKSLYDVPAPKRGKTPSLSALAQRLKTEQPPKSSDDDGTPDEPTKKE